MRNLMRLTTDERVQQIDQLKQTSIPSMIFYTNETLHVFIESLTKDITFKDNILT